MSLMIFGITVMITVIDIKEGRFVIDLQKPVSGDLIAGLTIQTNKNNDSKVDVKIELFKGIPF